MQVIPIQDVPSQVFSTSVGGQQSRIVLSTTSTGLYCTLYVNNQLIIGGVSCQNAAHIVQSSYLGFAGDIVFIDTQGSSPPSSPGLGTRYLLCYLTAAEVAAL